MKLYFATAFLLLAILEICCCYEISSRIAHGHDAQQHNAPYIISLQVIGTNYDSFRHTCGGVILNENWILTAGHCMMDRSPEIILLQAGRHNIQLKSEPTEQRRKIEWFKIHEKYEGDVAPNDLALIYVKEPFIWTEAVQPIQLPKSEKIHTGIGKLFGWGVLRNDDPILATILQTANLPIIPTAQCKKDFPGFGKYLKSTNICTFDANGTGICSSDSGGPLVQINQENQIEVIGIVSYGPGICGLPNQGLSVYVRVSSFIDWIEKVQNEFNNSTF